MGNKIVFKTLTLLLCGFLCIDAFAQEKTITGVVSDQNGSPLAGATVSEKGAKNSVTSTASGIFKITVPANTKALVFSYVGMKSQEISIEGKTSVAVSLNVADNSLNEVVVIGYGSTKRADVTSSIASISEKDIKNLPVSGADQALQGKLAGVTVNSNGGQPGGGVSVRVRGFTSVNGNEPLYVVDGVPIFSSAGSFNFSGLGGGGGQSSNSILSTLNPNDIQSIDVLKDASAQAIYGSVAANGVILITTKHGKAGEGKINYDVYYGQQYLPKKLDIMNLSEFGAYQNGIAVETNQTPTPEFVDPKVLGEGTNWQDAIFQTGQIQNHQLSFSGGQNKTTYYFSMNYFNQNGLLLNSKFNRYALRANIDHQVKSWLKTGFSMNASRSNQRLTLADEQDGTITQALLLSPVISIRNLDGTYGGQSAFGGVTYYTQSNPVAQSENRENTSQISKLYGSLYGDFKLASFLTFRSEFNYDFQMTQNQAFQASYASGTAIFASDLFKQANTSLFWAWKNYLSFNKDFGIHNVSATLGHENWTSRYEYLQAEAKNLNTNGQVSINNNGGSPIQPNGAAFQSAQESYFARAGYTYNNKYSLNVSFRADASSSFGPNNKWGYFPAASVGWTVTNEEFAKNIKGLDYLKLRFGGGAVGNQNGPNGAPTPLYTALISIGQNGFGPGNFVGNIGNLDLKWESVTTYNGGIDLSLFKRKLDVSVDVYKKTTKDMLLISSVPNFLGLSSVTPPIVNAGQMSNKGIDLSITSYNINKKDFTWKTNFIFSHYKNVLDKLISKTSSLDGRIQFNTITVTHTVPGQPVGSFYGGVTNGLFTLADATGGLIPVQFDLPRATSATTSGTWAGDVRFKDISGPDGKPDGKIDNFDVTFIGSPHPKFTYGLTNSVKYKEFDLSLFLQGSYGAKIYNFLRRQLEGIENLYSNQLNTVLNRYTATNTGAAMPRFTYNNKNNTSVSDRFVEDGSYLRIQNVSIGYNIPKNIAKKALMTSARVYVSAQNLYTFTKYTGYDPEIGAFNRGITQMNIDNGHYPNPRSFTVGINVEF
jgi:TonB-dependent starch-binding outer membrane protein SusC